MTVAITDAQIAIEQIYPILAGKPPAVQSIILADLLATFMAGHAPELRKDIWRMHLRLVRELIPLNEEQVFGEQGWHA